jgi:hypothetical protein
VGIPNRSSGRRWIQRVVIGLLALAALSGCAGTSESGLLEFSGWAPVVRFDGIKIGVGGGSAYPRTTCGYTSDPEPPVLITRRDRQCCGPDIDGDWMVPGTDHTLASLRLEFLPGKDPPARVEFSVGDAVYLSDALVAEGDATVQVQAKPAKPTHEDGMRGWAGRIVFQGLPLVSEVAYQGRYTIKRLVIEWQCRAE